MEIINFSLVLSGSVYKSRFWHFKLKAHCLNSSSVSALPLIWIKKCQTLLGKKKTSVFIEVSIECEVLAGLARSVEQLGDVCGKHAFHFRDQRLIEAWNISQILDLVR